MQFTYPELLWALLLLLIPIIIHLFQLRRFRKTQFTNVSLLQKVVAETNKSRKLKKWLLLATRLLLFACIIIAFAQPFKASDQALESKETVIYLDDSFSMQARTDKGDLLTEAVQELIRGIPSEATLSIFTNDRTYADVRIADIQNDLLSLEHTYLQFSTDEILLKANSLFSDSESSRKQLLLISDFQEGMYANMDSLSAIDLHMVQLRPDELVNISLDSVFVSNSSPTQLELKALLSASGELENSPVSIWNGDTLIAKTAAQFENGRDSELIFSLPQDMVIDGRIEISDSGLSYDNQLYFNFNKKEKTKVLVVGSASDDFLRRIYSEDDFILESFELSALNYSDIDKQNLIVLNQLEDVPNSLKNVLISYREAGGNLVIIPNKEADLISYNSLLLQLGATQFTELVSADQQITSISFQHPLYRNVFEKTVANFQYPSVENFFRTTSAASVVLRMQNGEAFLLGEGGVYIFCAPLDISNSNFTNSPLVVPTFYNMGALSLQRGALYYPLSTSTRFDLPLSLTGDEIVKVSRDNYEFIPMQQSFSNRTTLNFEEHPSQDGIFEILVGDSLAGNISFNYPRTESLMRYADIRQTGAKSVNYNISELLSTLENENRIKELWQWFVILALLMVLAEVLIQKLIK